MGFENGKEDKQKEDEMAATTTLHRFYPIHNLRLRPPSSPDLILFSCFFSVQVCTRGNPSPSLFVTSVLQIGVLRI